MGSELTLASLAFMGAEGAGEAGGHNMGSMGGGEPGDHDIGAMSGDHDMGSMASNLANAPAQGAPLTVLKVRVTEQVNEYAGRSISVGIRTP